MKVSASPKEEKCLTGETEINGENRGKSTKKPGKVTRQNKVSELVKESVWIEETESLHGVLETRKPENDNQHNKLQVTSQQTTCSHQPCALFKPVQDERRKLKTAKDRLFKAELFKSRRKHDREMDVITKRKNRLQNEIKNLMEEMGKLVEKADYLENMNKKLFTQTQNQLVDLLEYEAMDVRRPNFIFEELVNLQWSNLPTREKEIINYYQELVAILHKRIDFVTRRQDVPGTQEL